MTVKKTKQTKTKTKKEKVFFTFGNFFLLIFSIFSLLIDVSLPRALRVKGRKRLTFQTSHFPVVFVVALSVLVALPRKPILDMGSVVQCSMS